MTDWYADRPSVCEIAECSEVIAPGDDDSRYSPVIEGWVCWPCWESAETSASTAYLVQPGGEVTRWYVHEYDTMSEWGDSASDLPNGPKLERSWHRTDGWRGHYVTTPGDDWQEITSGWTTGNWGDAISKSKQNFNCWAQDLIEGKAETAIPVWIIFDTTSNVFSSGVGVFIPADCDVAQLDEAPPEF